MTVLSTTLEGPVGTALTAANSGFDAITAASGAAIVFAGSPAHGNTCMAPTTAATSTVAYAAWTTSLGGATVWNVRMNVKVATAVPINHRLLQFGNAAGSCLDIELRTDNTIRVRDSGSGAVIFASVPAGVWCRIEMTITFDVAVGQARLLVFNTMDSETPATDTTTQANCNFRGVPNYARFGIAGNSTNQSGLFLDDVALSTAGLLGPVVPPNKLPVVTVPASTPALWKVPVTVTGSASDPDSGPNPLTYSWSILEKPTGSGNTNTGTGVAFTFTPDKVGTYILGLSVYDGSDTTLAKTAVEVESPKYFFGADLQPKPSLAVLL